MVTLDIQIGSLRCDTQCLQTLLGGDILLLSIREQALKIVYLGTNLPSDIDALSAYISGISYKTNQYCWATIKSCAITKLKGLEDEQEKWVYKFVAVAEDTLNI